MRARLIRTGRGNGRTFSLLLILLTATLALGARPREVKAQSLGSPTLTSAVFKTCLSTAPVAVLSWSAPSTGTVTAYDIFARVDLNGDGSDTTDVSLASGIGASETSREVTLTGDALTHFQPNSTDDPNWKGFWVRARSASDTTASAVVPGSAPGPAAPTGLSWSYRADGTGLDFTWTEPAEGTNWKFHGTGRYALTKYDYTDADNLVLTYPDVNTASYTDGDLVEGTFYFYEIQTRSDCNVFSSVGQFTYFEGYNPPTYPDAPTISAVETTVSSATLSITMPLEDPKSPVDSVYVYVYKPSDPNFLLEAAFAPEDTLAITGLDSNTDYNFEVTLENAVGEGDPSEPMSATTFPGQPTLAATMAVVSADLTITPNASDGPATYEFVNVYYWKTSGGTEPTSTGTPDDSFIYDAGHVYTVTDLDPGAEYNFKVTMENSEGESVFSSTLTGSTVAASVPTLSSTAKTTGSVSLSWTGVPHAINYQIQYRQKTSPALSWTSLDPALVDETARTATVGGLAPGTEYEFQVRSVYDATTFSSWSTSLDVTTVTIAATHPQSAPSNLVIDVSGRTINISWDSLPTTDLGTGATGATGYHVQARRSTDGTPPVFDTTFDASLNDARSRIDFTGPPTIREVTFGQTQPGDYWFFRVRVRNDLDKNGPWTEVKTGRIAGGEPGQPVLTATVISTSVVSLSWAAPASVGAGPIAGYEIQRSDVLNPLTDDDWSNIGTVLADTRTLRSTGLSANSTYHYRVRAVNWVGAGQWSDLRTITTSAVEGVQAPSTVRNLRIGTESGNLVIRWNAPLTGTAPYQYEVLIYDFTIDDWPAVGTYTDNNSLTIQNPREGEVFHVTVRARTKTATNDAPWGGYVTSVSGGLGDRAPPPMNLSATRGDGTIELSWTAPNDTTVTGYRIQVRENDASRWTVLEENTESPATTYTHVGTVVNNRYRYRVATMNESGPSLTWSNVADVGGSGPSEPRNVRYFTTGEGANTVFTMAWSQPLRGTPPFEYELQIIVGAADPTSEASWEGSGFITRLTQTGFSDTSGDLYHFRVRARTVGTVAWGDWSPHVTGGVGHDVPDAPSKLTATRDSVNDRIDLTWEQTGAVTPSGYRIQVRVGEDPSWTLLEANTGSALTSYAHARVQPHTRYRYRVAALTLTGASSSYSNVVDVGGPPPPTSPPKRVEGLRARYRGDSNTLSWTVPDSGDAPIIGYQIEVSIDDQDWTILVRNTSSRTPHYVHNNVVAQSTYRYRVAAINEHGTGPTSDAVTASRILSVPSAPRALTAKRVLTPRGIDLRWQEPSDNGGKIIISYRVEVSVDGSAWDVLIHNSTSRHYFHSGTERGKEYQ